MSKLALVLKAVSAIVLAVILSSSAHAQPLAGIFDADIQNNSLAISPDERTAVVSDSESPNVIIYDLETRRVRGVLNDFITPRNILFGPAGRFFYVSDSTLGVVEKIDTASLKTVSVLPANPGAFGLTISRDKRTLYVNNEAASIVWAFDLAADRRVAVVTEYSWPRQSELPSQDGSPFYVIDFWRDRIRIVDTAANHIGDEISGFSKIRAISCTRDGRTILAANGGTNSIAVVDAPSRSIIGQIPVGKDPQTAALSPDERFAYSANLGDNTISVVELSSFQVVATISGFSELAKGAAIAPDRSGAYVLNRNLSISRVGLATNRIAYTIPSQAAIQIARFKAGRTQ